MKLMKKQSKSCENGRRIIYIDLLAMKGQGIRYQETCQSTKHMILFQEPWRPGDWEREKSEKLWNLYEYYRRGKY